MITEYIEPKINATVKVVTSADINNNTDVSIYVNQKINNSFKTIRKEAEFHTHIRTYLKNIDIQYIIEKSSPIKGVL